MSTDAERRVVEREVHRLLPDAVTLRHDLHGRPRVGGEEEPVARLLASLLGRPDAESIAGGRILRFGRSDAPATAIRAELDALPLAEETGVEWAASNGAMHACGHDVHMAATWAVASALHRYLPGEPLVVLLQPREEVYPCGAVDLLASPRWSEAGIGAVIGAHVQPRLRSGEVSLLPGVVNAASDEFTVTVVGEGGHAAYPHLTHDPVVAAAAVVGALQQVTARRADPMSPTVLGIGSISGGTSANVVPSSVALRGILRTYDTEARDRAVQSIGSIASAVAAGHGCTAEVVIDRGEPPLDNDPALVSATWPHLRDLGLREGAALRSCGADDFAYYAQAVPSTMTFVGVGDAPDGPGLHHPRFLPPDDAVHAVARALLAGFWAAQDLLGDAPPRRPALVNGDRR